MSSHHYIEQFIDFFNNIEITGSKELEVKIFIHNSIKAPQFIKYPNNPSSILKHILSYILSSQNEVTQSINFISTATDHESIIKELVFVNAVQVKDKKHFYKKKSHHTPIYITSDMFGSKITFNSETHYEGPEPKYNLIRFKHRISTKISKWRLDFTFVKLLHIDTMPHVSVLTNIRDTLFGVERRQLMDSDLWKYASQIEVEFELTEPKCEALDLTTIYDFLANILNSVNSENILIHLENILYPGNNKNKSSLKRLLPNAVEMTKRMYFDNIIDYISDFYITDKADGLRTILIIRNSQVSYFDTQHHNLKEEKLLQVNELLIECELINDHFYSYDILVADGKSVINKPFEDRLKILKYYVLKLKLPYLSVKEFIKLSSEYAEQIRHFYKQALTNVYKIDGLIFTSCKDSYLTTKYYKWKPTGLMSIDFLVKKCPPELLGIAPYNIISGKVLYILFTGIKYTDYKFLKLDKIRCYEKIFPFTQKHYFPIQFSPSDFPYAHIWYHEEKDLDGEVIEMTYDTIDKQWNMLRIRNDRKQELKQNYYGNYFPIAESIWRNFFNPLTLEILCSTKEEISKEFYFIVNASKKYETLRAYNNMVKYNLVDYVTSNKKVKWVVDLGCGKGQDLPKYIRFGIPNALLIDVNQNNISEVINRKYNMKNNSTRIYTCCSNLNNPSEDIMEDLYRRGIIPTGLKKKFADLIICNFAIHYMFDSIQMLENFVSLIDSLLNTNGKVIITCLNGEKVLAALKSNQWGDGERHLIKCNADINKYPALRTKVKQVPKIEIMLPFSNGQLYQENLVSLDLLNKVFKKKKIIVDSQGSFKGYYENEGNWKFDKLDLEYIDMLSYTIYTRSNSK